MPGAATALPLAVANQIPPVERRTAAREPAVWSHATRRSVSAAPLVAAVDVVAVVTIACLVLVRPAGAQWPEGLNAFLSLRISIRDLGMVVGFAAAVLAVFEVAGLYEAALVRQWRDEMARVIGATAAIATLVAVPLVATYGSIDTQALLRFWSASLAAVAVARTARARTTRSAARCRRALIVGSGPRALRVCRDLSSDPLTCYQVLGFVDTSEAPRSPFVTRRTLGSLDQLEAILVREHVDEVHVGLPIRSRYAEIQETIRVCERIGVTVKYAADIFGTALARPRVDPAAGALPRVELQVVRGGAPLVVKRALDLVGAIIALTLLAPLMMLTAAAIKLTSDGPVLFAQERYGLNRRRFRMLKFRTMVQDAERLQVQLEAQNEAQGPVFKMTRDPRVTPLGRWLRRTSIDELPQLFNVLKGDMSLVGPRPLPLRDVALFPRPAHMRRFSVRPGMTGLWQVSGRSRLGFDQWIRLDLHYIDSWSLVLDLRILARTLPAVLRGTGAA